MRRIDGRITSEWGDPVTRLLLVSYKERDAKMTDEQRAFLRSLPQVDELLKMSRIQELSQQLGRNLVTDMIRETIEGIRADILDGKSPVTATEALAEVVITHAYDLQQPTLRRVINATGVILHTNLGRSILAKAAQEAIITTMRGYSTLEYDTGTQERGSRHDHIEHLLCAITGAEAGMAVNNNAAAVMLVLGALARDREVLVSRGELVEIGGSFRIPDIMEQSGAHMVEVGTTNRTSVKDYERALTEKTTLIAKIHPSNYLMTGFTKDARIGDLVSLAHEHGIPIYQDQGTGLIFDLEEVFNGETSGTYDEPTVSELIAEGCDLVSFSGDKLLGGPQAGLIVGKKELVECLKSHPLARAFRLDKLSLAALAATLQICLDVRSATEELPTLRMLGLTLEELLPRARRLQSLLEKSLETGEATVELTEEVSRAGGGSLPALELPTWVVALSQVRGGFEALVGWLTAECTIPVIARVHDDHLLLDMRTILDDEELDEVAQAIIMYFSVKRT